MIVYSTSEEYDILITRSKEMEDLFSIYQSQLKQKKDQLQKQYENLKEQLEESVTKEELHDIEKQITLLTITIKELEIPLQQFSTALTDHKKDSDYYYQQLQQPLLQIQQQDDKLQKQLRTKQETLDKVNVNRQEMEKDVIDIDKQATEMKIMEETIVAMSAVIEEKLDEYQEFDLDRLQQVSIAKEILMSISVYMILQAVIRGKTLLPGMLLTSYLTGKGLEYLFHPSNDSLDLYQDLEYRIHSLLDDTRNMQETLEQNITYVDDIEVTLERQYEIYLSTNEFQQLLILISGIRKTLIKQVDRIRESEKKLYYLSERNKVMVKTLESS